jgi:hypothetical protein
MNLRLKDYLLKTDVITIDCEMKVDFLVEAADVVAAVEIGVSFLSSKY